MAHPVMKGYKMQATYLLVVFAIVVQQSFAGTFPEFIKKCKISDSKFDDCVLNSANDLLSTVINGDVKYGIPPLMLSNLTRIYNLTAILGMEFTNLSVHTNGDLIISDIHFDFKQKILTFTAKFCQIELTGRYATVGKCPGHLRSENGKVNMTFDDVEFNVSMPLDFKTIQDKKYLKAVSCKLIVNGRNFRFRPYDRIRSRMEPGVMLTWEQWKEYLSYIDNIPQLVKCETEQLDQEPAEALNKIFDLLPFDELFSP